MQDIEHIVQELRKAIDGEDFEEIAEARLEELSQLPDPKRAIGPLFQVLEDHLDTDFGSPGPLVHYLEQYSGPDYEDPLVASLAKRPTVYTVWMLNRLINATEGPRFEELLGLMRTIAARPDIDEDTREQCKEFLEFHCP